MSSCTQPTVTALQPPTKKPRFVAVSVTVEGSPAGPTIAPVSLVRPKRNATTDDIGIDILPTVFGWLELRPLLSVRLVSKSWNEASRLASPSVNVSPSQQYMLRPDPTFLGISNYSGLCQICNISLLSTPMRVPYGRNAYSWNELKPQIVGSVFNRSWCSWMLQIVRCLSLSRLRFARGIFLPLES